MKFLTKNEIFDKKNEILDKKIKCLTKMNILTKNENVGEKLLRKRENFDVSFDLQFPILVH